jgi:site-specific recombinase XerD
MYGITKIDLRFNRKNQLDTHNKAPIEIRMYLDGQTSYKGTGISIKPEGWSKLRRRPKDNHINQECARQELELKSFEKEFRQKNGRFTIKDFKLLHKPEAVPEPTNVSFTKYFAEQLEAEKGGHKVVLNNKKLTLKYLKELRPEIAFCEIDFQMIRDFDFFLKAKKLHTNTIKRHHINVRAYIKLATKSRLISFNPYEDFKIPRADAYSSFCTEAELKQLENLTFNVEKRKERFMERCRDMFLFSAYTGLRYSDTAKVQANHFQQTKDGLILDYQANKTRKFGVKYLSMLFGGKPERLALKYMPKDSNSILFKNMKQQQVNVNLKVLAERAGITKKLRFKDSRNTFAVVLLDKKIPINIVQSEMQHSNLATTQIYTKHTPEQTIQALKQTDWT